MCVGILSIRGSAAHEMDAYERCTHSKVMKANRLLLLLCRKSILSIVLAMCGGHCYTSPVLNVVFHAVANIGARSKVLR